MDAIGGNSTVWYEIVQGFKNEDTLMHISSTLVSVIGMALRISHLFNKQSRNFMFTKNEKGMLNTKTS